VVIQFETSFEKKKSSVETITPMKEKDGTGGVGVFHQIGTKVGLKDSPVSVQFYVEGESDTSWKEPGNSSLV